jgi:hypothetical protein
MAYRSEAKERILASVALIESVYGVRRGTLLKKNRSRNVVQARQSVYVYARKYWKYPYQLIGDIMRRNHATVIYGVKGHKEMMARHSKSKRYIFPDYVENYMHFEKAMNSASDEILVCKCCNRPFEYESATLDVVTNNNYESR